MDIHINYPRKNQKKFRTESSNGELICFWEPEG